MVLANVVLVAGPSVEAVRPPDAGRAGVCQAAADLAAVDRAAEDQAVVDRAAAGQALVVPGVRCPVGRLATLFRDGPVPQVGPVLVVPAV
ncbi:hypothetical protein [Actinophytocola sp.]|uniref:hypothetical protein n=1 Tax=Actinophytocola sp. TaxID=1872138 RepID=UPI002ED041FA